MSLYKDASLVMIPSAYKDGKLYSIRPTDGSGDFTFSRGSNLAATRVDVNGLIEKGRENLLPQSNSFDTTWGNASTTETGGQTDKSGGTDAWKIDLTAAGGWIFQSISTSGVQAFSVYAKAGTLDWVRLYASGSSTSFAYFDLMNGLVGITSGTIDTNIELISNGYYRIDISFNHSSATAVRIYPAQADNDLTATSGNIYIQDAQLEQGLVATDYIETGASTAQAGILEDMPRLDYSGGASCPALLLEPQRSNIVTESEYFVNAWQNVGCTITTNATQSPEGKNNATLLVGTNGGAARVQDYFGPLSGVHTYSLFVKSTGTATRLNLQTNDVGGATFSIPASGAPTLYAQGTNVGTPFIEDYSNGWYRVGFAFTPSGGGVNNYFQIYPDSANNLSSVYAYGAQVESGSYPTSYIPTYGSSVTRSNDAASLTGVGDLLGDSNGTLFVEAEYFEDNAHIVLGDGTLNNIFPFRFRTSNFQNDMKVDNVSQGNIVVSPISTNTRYKVASRYSLNDRAVYFDGVLQDTDSTNEVFPEGTLTRIGFDRGDNAAHFYGRVYQLAVFPTALTNAELAALTE